MMPFYTAGHIEISDSEPDLKTSFRKASSGYGRHGRDFDGSSDYGSALSGAGLTDVKFWTLSCWLRIDGGDGTIRHIIHDEDSMLGVWLDAANKFNCDLWADTGFVVKAAEIDATTGFTASSSWIHYMASTDVGADVRNLYVNDADDIGTNSRGADTTIYWRSSDFRYLAAGDAAKKFDGAVSEFWMTNEYVDFSIESERRKFITASSSPAALGSQGQRPTGIQPLIYCPDGDPSNNLGSLGNYTVNGAPTNVSGPGV